MALDTAGGGISFRQALDGAGAFATLTSDALYDDIVNLARQLCGSAIALITVAGRDGLLVRAWTGLDPRDLPDARVFCALATDPRSPFEIADALGDARFADQPLVRAGQGLRFCAGIALAGRHGEGLGSLCVLDRHPRTLDAAQRDALTMLARLASALLDAQCEPSLRPDPAVRVSESRGAWTPLPLAAPPQRMFQDRYAVAIIELDGGSVPVPVRERAMRQIEDITAAVLGHEDVLSRDGPGELLVVFAHAADAAAALERIVAASGDLPGQPRIAVGAAVGRHDRDAMEDVFLDAEAALVRARTGDGRRIVFAAPPLNT